MEKKFIVNESRVASEAGPMPDYDELLDAIQSLRAALRSTSDALAGILDAGKLPNKGRSADDQDQWVSIMEALGGSVTRAQCVLRDTQHLSLSVAVEGSEPVKVSLATRLAEAALLAQEFEDTPLWRRANVREGSLTIQQQAERFATAGDDAIRADAALWAWEGYVLLSSALPEVYRGAAPDEGQTGWVTANQIAKLFGGESNWIAEIAAEWPDAAAPVIAEARARGIGA